MTGRISTEPTAPAWAGDNLAIDGSPTALGVWVYIPEGVPVPWLRAQIATSTDGGNSWTNAYINFSNGSAGAGEGLKSGWPVSGG